MFNIKKLDKIMFNKEIVISFSYGNYNKSIGGTDKLVLAHQQILNERGITYFYVFPINKIRRYRISFINLWGVIIDGSYVFTFTSEDLMKVIFELSCKLKIKGIFVHHLLGIDIEALIKIISMIKAPLLFYIHDYYTICSQINLLKNGLAYCGSGAISIAKCGNCSYYNKSINHSKAVYTLLNRNRQRLRVILPSESAKKIWSSAFPDFEEQTDLFEHQKLIGTYRGGKKTIKDGETIKVAYVGAQARHKGWPEWHKLVMLVGASNINDFKFYHFGKNISENRFVTTIPVSFHQDGFDAMISALRVNEIDCVLLWSICPETYSFTFFESMAVNAFVITYKDSGNIAEYVSNNKNGIVLSDTSELIQFFSELDTCKDSINAFKDSDFYGHQSTEFNKGFIKYLQ